MGEGEWRNECRRRGWSIHHYGREMVAVDGADEVRAKFFEDGEGIIYEEEEEEENVKLTDDEVVEMLMAQKKAASKFWAYPDQQWQLDFQSSWLQSKFGVNSATGLDPTTRKLTTWGE